MVSNNDTVRVRQTSSAAFSTTTDVVLTIGRLVPMAESRRLIKAGVKDALGKLGAAKPFKITAPCGFELEYHVSSQADAGAMIPGVKRIDARTLGFTANDYIEGFRMLRAMIAIAQTR